MAFQCHFINFQEAEIYLLDMVLKPSNHALDLLVLAQFSLCNKKAINQEDSSIEQGHISVYLSLGSHNFVISDTKLMKWLSLKVVSMLYYFHRFK
ncbi:hypothetical protein TNCT_537501 [Trichonephila clavata]|uniref:Uncharacterized protein n=1 Tax=Trichonephila clavata TaxID=2740835 RepID=A0A8X6FJD2_TRICU|nr:hypothetical protein TNCT_537501 [Trichonephila clavata]